MPTKTILKAHKVRLYPTAEQQESIDHTMNCCRFAFNHMLARQQKIYKRRGEHLSAYDMSKVLTQMKGYLPWLRDADSQALKYACGQVEDAYKRFFKKQGGFPRFQKKHQYAASYTTTKGASIHLEQKRMKLPLVGWIEARGGAVPSGIIKRATVHRSATGKYYASILMATTIELPPPTTNVIGIDVGIAHFATCSDGRKFENHKFFLQAQKKLAKEQRKLARMVRGSHNYYKQCLKVARCHETVANRRSAMLHALSSTLVNENQVICVEDLNIKGMVRNRRLAKYIVDAGWGEFIRQLEYKADWYDRVVVKVPTFYPSSQTCSVCGYPHPATKNLAVRHWTCPECGSRHDRDINSAINILMKGVGMLALPASA